MRKIDFKQVREEFSTYIGNIGELCLDDEVLEQTGNVIFRVADGITPGGLEIPNGSNISNTVKGFINLVGDRPNQGDDAWFESVVVRGNYAYVLGSDSYINDSNNRSKLYKFDVRDGTLLWTKQISAGKGAEINVTVDAGVITLDSIALAGTGYIVGEELVFAGWNIGGSHPLNLFVIVVDTIDVNGEILTASVKPGYNAAGLSGTYYNLTAYNDDAQGSTCCVSYDDYNNKVIVVSNYQSGQGDVTFDNYWVWANIYVIDPTDGTITQTVTMSDGGDVLPTSIATYNKELGAAVVGMKFDEYREFGTLTMLATGNGYFDILKSNLDPEHYPGAPFNPANDFWVMGTGIAIMENVDNVNYYENLTSNVREGSGAEFSITDNGDTTYTLTAITNGGINYLAGHKIKILGTSLGGATPANDAIVTVTTAVSGVITAATVSGAAAGGSLITYTGLTGANHEVGSGFLGIYLINPTTGAPIYFGNNSQGTNYVTGDLVTFSGTQFAGGTSPANDITFIVVDVGGSGELISFNTQTGTGPTTGLRINVDTVDFTVEGSWTMKQNLGGEAFIWTPAWSNAIGGPSGDRFYDVCWSSDGNYLYAVGTGVYEVDYLQALVVKFNATTGAVIWSKDIKFTEAASNDREARAVVEILGSTDIMVAGAWYNGDISRYEIILTRVTSAGTVVWQKTYATTDGFGFDYEFNLKSINDGIILSFEQNTNNNNGLAYLQIDPTNGTVIRHRVLSADGNSNYNYYDTPTANFADIYTDTEGDYIVMAGYTYVPTDYYYNSLLFKLPIAGLHDIAFNERYSLGEHILNRHDWVVTTVTPAFDSFIPTEHINTIINLVDAKGYKTITPAGVLENFIYPLTDDSAGYIDFGDGSKQSFATDKIPQIPAANDYYLTPQDSGKHIFFEHENGTVYIPHRFDRYFPVGFTFTIVNTTGSDCWISTMYSMMAPPAVLKLAGRNISTTDVGIPDSGSGSMVTLIKIKDGYTIENSDGPGYYADMWMVSGPGDLYDNY